MSARLRQRIGERAQRKTAWRRYLRGEMAPTSFVVEAAGEDGVWWTVWSGDRESSPSVAVPFAAYDLALGMFGRATEDT